MYSDAARYSVAATPGLATAEPPVLVLALDGMARWVFCAGAGEIVNLRGGTSAMRRRFLALVAKRDPSGRRVAHVLLSDLLPDAPTALQCVAEPLQRQGLPPGAALSRALLELNALGADGLAGRHPASLGRVDARLVQLARAMAARPRLLVLETPELGLAPSTARSVRLALGTLASTFDTCILMSTNDPQMQAMASLCVDMPGAGTSLSVRVPS